MKQETTFNNDEFIEILEYGKIKKVPRTINASPILLNFWQLYARIQYIWQKNMLGNNILNHVVKDKEFVAINLNHLQNVATHMGLDIGDIDLLKKELKTCVYPKFIEYKSIYSVVLKKVISCYIFEYDKNNRYLNGEV